MKFFVAPARVGLFAVRILWLCLGLSTCAVEAAEPASTNETLRAAEAAFRKGDYPGAIALAGKIITATPSDYRACFLRGRAYEETRQHEKAMADYDAGLKLNPKAAMGFQLRGLEHFRLGHIEQSIADFDQFIELVPGQSPYHWQRGIALYYAGRYEDGRKQFELHQTVNPNDVENAAWHYACVARASGVGKARASLIPIEGDPRVPMKQIHALF